jgi:ribosomal protein S18 acetylase RimI-like enzyme
MSDESFEIRRGGVDDIDSLEPLWEGLQSAHRALPDMRPTRPGDESWALRRAKYEEWLARDDHALLLAERGGNPIGYAVISFGNDFATWDVGDTVAEIETLSVLESERGSGVGRALIEAASEAAEEGGARTMTVGVAHSNADAIRFYEREGFSDFYVLLMKP